MPVVKGEDGRYHRVTEEIVDAAEVLQTSSKVSGAECLGCSLATRPLCSPLRGEEAAVVFIGEAPGSGEISSQQFFVGRAGRLLMEGIRQTGLAKYRYALNNACLCYPSSDFPRSAISHCRKRLLSELAASNPELLIPVGAVSLTALLGEEQGITSSQGMVYSYQLGGRIVKMLPCFHPAAVLRRPELFYDFMNALNKARLVLEGCSLVDVPPEHFQMGVANNENVCDYLRQLASYSRLYADLETTGYSPWHDDIICISVAAGDGRDVKVGYTFGWQLFRNEEALGLLIDMLENRVVGYWNGIFDCMFLQQYGIRASVGEDVMLKHYTLDERSRSQSLKGTARVLCNAVDWEEPLKPYLPSKQTSFAAVPYEVLAKYAALDACYTGTLDLAIDTLMEGNNRDVYSRILMPATNMFLDVVNRGILIDVSRLEELRIEYSKKLEATAAWLADFTKDAYFNPSSTQDARRLCYDILGLPRYSESTARAVLEPYQSQYEPIEKLLQFRSDRKMLGTYLEGILEELDEHNRLHPNIRVNGTVTGRLASGRGGGERSRRAINALGVPKEKGGIKKLFIADPGFLLLEGDGSQMELRVLGALSSDKAMMADFSSGIDFHGVIRDRLFGRGTKKESYTHQEELDAKTIAFGPPYGRSVSSIAAQLKCTLEEAQKFLDLIWGHYPNALAWLDDSARELKETGEVRSYYGRVRHWGLITPEVLVSAEKEARNFRVQSAATDTNLLVMIELYKSFDHDFILPLLPTHDAILCRVAESRADEARKTFKLFAEHLAQELLNTDMPFVYEVGVGKSWGELK